MTYSPVLIQIGNEIEFLQSFSGVEPWVIAKRANSPTTIFTYDKLVYTQYREDPFNDAAVHTGCGNLVYSHEFPGEYDNFEADGMIYR